MLSIVYITLGNDIYCFSWKASRYEILSTHAFSRCIVCH